MKEELFESFFLVVQSFGSGKLLILINKDRLHRVTVGDGDIKFVYLAHTQIVII